MCSGRRAAIDPVGEPRGIGKALQMRIDASDLWMEVFPSGL